MKLSTTLLVAVLLTSAAAATAAAQPGQPPPPPPGYGPSPYYGPPPAYQPQARRGLAIGFGFGVGGMDSQDGIRCDGCSSEPVAGGFNGHIGAMLAPNLAILLEGTVTGQQLDAVGAQTLMQAQLLAAVQYWLTPMLWIKGGLGSSHLSISYDDGYETQSEELDTGMAAMAAIGYEVLHAPRFAIDVDLRLSTGTYNGLDDKISAGLVGVGFSWY